MERHFVLIGFLQFLVILVLTTIPRRVVSWLWSKPSSKSLPAGALTGTVLDFVLIMGEKHLHRVVKEYVTYYNRARPHQGIDQAIPEGAPGIDRADGKVISLPVLGGLHHDYRRAA